MLDPQALLIDHLLNQLHEHFHQYHGPDRDGYLEAADRLARLALHRLADCDALYHNLEHTVMVTSAGQAILAGRQLAQGDVSPGDWLHYTLALLCHDIGYVKGICTGDRGRVFATGLQDGTMELPPGATAALLGPYHVDRSKQFVRERLAQVTRPAVDPQRVAALIEMTRFPVPDQAPYRDTCNLPGLARAADLIGQLGDPGYLRKVPALFSEFQESGMAEGFGYSNPGDMRQGYPSFFQTLISPYIQDALSYLRLTSEGRRWIASLHAHVQTASQYL